MNGLCFLVEYDSLRRHVTIDYAEGLGCRRPGNVMDWTFFVCRRGQCRWGVLHERIRSITELYSRVKAAVGAQNVHVRLAIVTAITFINIC